MKENKPVLKETISVKIQPGEFLMIINTKRKLASSSKVTFGGENIINIAMENSKKINSNFVSLIKAYLTSLNPIRSTGKQCFQAISDYTGLSLEESELKLKEILNKLHCPNTEIILESFPYKLEAYEKQRLMLAVTFLIKPKLIILDDSIFNVEPAIKYYILEQINKLKEQNSSFILISKKLHNTISAVDNIAIMYKGTVVEYGRKDLVLSNPLHPHTRSILNFKEFLNFTEKSTKIVHYVKEINNLPRTGCSFCLKCKEASYDCIYMAPTIKTIGNERQVICVSAT